MPKGIRKLQISFEETHLTHFGGIFLIHWFCKKVKLNQLLQKYLALPRKSNHYYSSELILAILYGIITGIYRLSASRILQYNGSFQNIVGLKTFPYASTLRRFLIKFAPFITTGICKIQELLRARVFLYPHPLTSLILDLDSTILTVYGNLEGAKKGYNPEKRNRLSHHPLLCFESNTQECWHALFRSGDAHTSKGAEEFLQTCLAKIPKYLYRLRIRADAGFYDHKIIDFLDGENIGYVIVAKITNPIKEILEGLRYIKFKGNWESAEFSYQPRNWQEAHRFIVIRRPIPEEPSTQLTLFSLECYTYQVLVTNLDLDPENVWRFYNGRAKIELIIKELKGDYPLGKIPTKNYKANEAYFHLLLFAYNIVNWFKRLCLPIEFSRATLYTIRTELLVLPARFVKIHHKNLLKLPVRFVHQKLFYHAMRKIERLKI